MIMPYLNFSGNCEEALRFYVQVFGGEIQHMVKYGDVPAGHDSAPEESLKDKVMHAQVSLTEAGGLSGADATWPVEKGSCVHIHAHLSSISLAQSAFAALADGGNVVAPLQSNPPPDDYGVSGMVCDRYGFTWILSARKD